MNAAARALADANRMAIAVTFLATDEQARRLVVSWPLVGARLRGRAVLHAWSKSSGVPQVSVERLAEVLFAHEICLPDRSVDPDALRVIHQIAASTLTSLQRGAR